MQRLHRLPCCNNNLIQYGHHYIAIIYLASSYCFHSLQLFQGSYIVLWCVKGIICNFSQILKYLTEAFMCQHIKVHNYAPHYRYSTVFQANSTQTGTKQQYWQNEAPIHFLCVSCHFVHTYFFRPKWLTSNFILTKLL